VSQSSPTTPLTGVQRKYLRGLAHGLDPVVHVGQKGLTEGVLSEIDHALDHHELVKIKIAADRDERREVADEIVARLGPELIGSIGTVAILFRRNPDRDVRKIRFP
jgi:RNA-binding protein